MRAFVLTSGKQLTFASVLAVCALWMGICTAAMMVNAMALSATDQEIARTQAKYERWIADRQARLTRSSSAMSRSCPSGRASEPWPPSCSTPMC